MEHGFTRLGIQNVGALVTRGLMIDIAASKGVLLENLKLDELAAKRVYEFAFIIEPLKIQGATGSTVAPIAIR